MKMQEEERMNYSEGALIESESSASDTYRLGTDLLVAKADMIQRIRLGGSKPGLSATRINRIIVSIS